MYDYMLINDTKLPSNFTKCSIYKINKIAISLSRDKVTKCFHMVAQIS